MPIIVNVDVMLAKRKMSSGELADKVGITQANLSILKTGKAKAVRFSTLSALCKALDCQPGDILEYQLSLDNFHRSPPLCRYDGGRFLQVSLYRISYFCQYIVFVLIS